LASAKSGSGQKKTDLTLPIFKAMAEGRWEDCRRAAQKLAQEWMEKHGRK